MFRLVNKILFYKKIYKRIYHYIYYTNKIENNLKHISLYHANVKEV